MGQYDHAMKVLVDADPLAIARFVLRQGKHTRHLAEPEADLKMIAQLNTEFAGTKAEADGLLLLENGQEKPFLVHIEFQSKRDGEMADRLLDYCRRARRKHGPLPIISCVIYLRADGAIEEPPYCWPVFDEYVNMICCPLGKPSRAGSFKGSI